MEEQNKFPLRPVGREPKVDWSSHTKTKKGESNWRQADEERKRLLSRRIAYAHKETLIQY